MKIGKLEINLEELRNFLVVAKKNGYANGKEKRREIGGSKQNFIGGLIIPK